MQATTTASVEKTVAAFYRLGTKKNKKRIWGWQALLAWQPARLGGQLSDESSASYRSTLSYVSDEAAYFREYVSSADVSVLGTGFAVKASDLIENSFLEPIMRVQPDAVGPAHLADHPVLVVPTGGLYGLSQNTQFKAGLESYVRLGGTAVVFSPAAGLGFRGSSHAVGRADPGLRLVRGQLLLLGRRLRRDLPSDPRVAIAGAGDIRHRRVLRFDPGGVHHPAAPDQEQHAGDVHVPVRRRMGDRHFQLRRLGRLQPVDAGRAGAHPRHDRVGEEAGRASGERAGIDGVDHALGQERDRAPGEPGQARVAQPLTQPGDPRGDRSRIVPVGGTAEVPFSHSFTSAVELGIYHVDYELLDEAGVTVQPVAEDTRLGLNSNC